MECGIDLGSVQLTCYMTLGYCSAFFVSYLRATDTHYELMLVAKIFFWWNVNKKDTILVR